MGNWTWTVYLWHTSTIWKNIWLTTRYHFNENVMFVCFLCSFMQYIVSFTRLSFAFWNVHYFGNAMTMKGMVIWGSKALDAGIGSAPSWCFIISGRCCSCTCSGVLLPGKPDNRHRSSYSYFYYFFFSIIIIIRIIC